MMLSLLILSVISLLHLKVLSSGLLPASMILILLKVLMILLCIIVKLTLVIGSVLLWTSVLSRQVMPCMTIHLEQQNRRRSRPLRKNIYLIYSCGVTP